MNKWSWIVDDYVALENSFQGISTNNGVDFGLVRFSGSDDVFGYVRLILPNSDASNKDIKRGDIFTHVNGTQITVSNYRDLLYGSNDSYTLSLAKIENNTITPTGVDVALTKVPYTENPVYLTKIHEIDGKKIGYLMYNAFTSNFDDEMNSAFLEFKNGGITDLVLDLRYNPGGSVRTSVFLASMITGQFTGQLFTKEKWNNKLQQEFQDNYPEYLINNFADKLANGNAINSLNLDKLHIIVSNSSASASELIINGLNPYINVKLIGERTVGKYVASITLYDSPNFTKDNVNLDHTYAMQPIVLQEVNVNGQNSPLGFEPHIPLSEDFGNMGIIGDINEPLLETAINDILGISPKATFRKSEQVDHIFNSRLDSKIGNNMYIERMK